MSGAGLDNGEDPMAAMIKAVGTNHGKLLTTCGFQAEVFIPSTSKHQSIYICDKNLID
jgi:hypothetical protein